MDFEDVKNGDAPELELDQIGDEIPILRPEASVNMRRIFHPKVAVRTHRKGHFLSSIDIVIRKLTPPAQRRSVIT